MCQPVHAHLDARHPAHGEQQILPGEVSRNPVLDATEQHRLGADEDDARELIKRILNDCNADVLTAATATEALTLLKHARPDLMVSDLGMPEVDGYGLLDRIRALGPAHGGNLPAIALTAFARSEDRVRALASGFLAHISKPVELAELITVAASLVQRSG